VHLRLQPRHCGKERRRGRKRAFRARGDSVSNSGRNPRRLCAATAITGGTGTPPFAPHLQLHAGTLPTFVQSGGNSRGSPYRDRSCAAARIIRAREFSSARGDHSVIPERAIFPRKVGCDTGALSLSLSLSFSTFSGTPIESARGTCEEFFEAFEFLLDDSCRRECSDFVSLIAPPLFDQKLVVETLDKDCLLKPGGLSSAGKGKNLKLSCTKSSIIYDI